MVETITPVVHGGSRTRWAVAVLVHASAATAVAGVFGALLGVAGSLLGAPWGSGGSVVVATLAGWALAHEALGIPFPVPQMRRQVPDWWRTFFSPFASAALYGAGLGVGFFTYLLHATFVVVSVGAFASGRPAVGAGLVAAFGLARGLSAVAGVRGPDVVHSLASFAGRPVPLTTIHVVALAAVALAAVASARGPVELPALAGAVLAVAFGWGAAWKTARPAAWRAIVARYRLGRAAGAAAIAVPLAEASVAVLAVAGAGRAAAAVALASLIAFTVAAARRRLVDASPAQCGCFGSSDTSFPTLVARNAVLAVLSAIALVDRGGVVLRAPARSEAVPFALTLAGAAGVIVVVRSVGRSLREGRT